MPRPGSQITPRSRSHLDVDALDHHEAALGEDLLHLANGALVLARNDLYADRT